MNNSELLKAIASDVDGLSQSDVKKVYAAFTAAVISALKKGEKVDLGPILGKLQVVERSAREGVNPRTGEKMRIAASKAVKYTASKKAKEEVNA